MSYRESAKRVVYGSPETAAFTAADWVGLALAALDQAGITPAQLAKAFQAVHGRKTEEAALLDELGVES